MNRVSIICHTAHGVLPWHLKPYHNLHYIVHARENDTIQNIFERVVQRTKILNGKKFTDLEIYVHGKGKRYIVDYVDINLVIPGSGMRLGREILSLSNIHLVEVLKDRFEKIVVYSCGVAAYYPENKGDNGQLFCGLLAMLTNTEVIASMNTQYYLPGDISNNGVMNQGEWEGTVYSFSPVNGRSSIIFPNEKS